MKKTDGSTEEPRSPAAERGDCQHEQCLRLAWVLLRGSAAASDGSTACLFTCGVVWHMLLINKFEKKARAVHADLSPMSPSQRLGSLPESLETECDGPTSAGNVTGTLALISSSPHYAPSGSVGTDSEQTSPQPL